MQCEKLGGDSHKARELPMEEFKREVSKRLTEKETGPWEMLYFKAYKSQLPVIELALETAGLMLGSNKSGGDCLEMICADYLAGVSLEAGDRDALLPSLIRLAVGFAKTQTRQLVENVQFTMTLDGRLHRVLSISNFRDNILPSILDTNYPSHEREE